MRCPFCGRSKVVCLFAYVLGLTCFCCSACEHKFYVKTCDVEKLGEVVKDE